MAAETGKQRQTRIELTYYRRPDALARRRRALASFAVLAAAAWLILAPTFDARRRPQTAFFQWNRIASPGVLAHPHAAWTDRCEVCHTSFAPINGSRWSPLPGAADPHAGDSLCVACHAAPAHQPMVAETMACAECHRDHRGADARLSRPPDSNCTNCHGNLDAHRPTGGAIAARVSGFDLTHHPEFAALRPGAVDPGHLKFDHALHLASGLTLEPGGRPFTSERLAKDARSRYASSAAGVDAPIQLDCRQCHQLETDLKGTGSGAYMVPISYEQHCADCHPLGFEPERPERQVTHGQSPALVVEELRGLYAQAALATNDQLLKRYIPDRPLPGRPVDAIGRTAGEAIDAKMNTALRRLFGADPGAGGKQAGCLECHEVASAPEQPPRSIADYAALRLAPSDIPAVWFRHARFDHSAHRATACIDCHKAATASGSRSNADILLPDMASCTACHAPAQISAEGQRGGVDHSCTECHAYHGRERSDPAHDATLTTPSRLSAK